MTSTVDAAVKAKAFEDGSRESNWAVRILESTRFQLLGGILCAVLLPGIMRGALERLPDTIASYDNSIIGTLCALLLGYMIYRKVTGLPGASALVNVVPAFLTSYGLVVALFFLLRLDYSRYQFLSSLCFVVAWYGLIQVVLARLRRPIFGVIPAGRAKALLTNCSADTVTFTSPDEADRRASIPLVADFKSDDLGPKWQRYLAEQAIQGRPVFNAKQVVESLEGRVRVDHLSENVGGALAPDILYAQAKRYVDFLSAVVELIMLMPVMVLTAVAIRMDSRGNPIFSQVRMGYRGQPFTVYKFRSMRVQTEQDYGKRDTHMTASDDDRITRVGRFIRMTRLDELPQIINILRGEMSWIGPRPETLKLSEWYEREIPFYRYRHVVRPGITGWAQIKQGHVTSVDDVREKLEFDFYYVKNFSIWLDALIFAQTVKVMLTGKGAV